MKITKELVPIKAHFFFFMAAMGPILPQLPVIGKELGISSVIMGTVSGILPIIFLLAKPVFGMLVDILRDQRKSIFIALIFAMTTSFSILYFLPANSSSQTFSISNLTEPLQSCSEVNMMVKEGSTKNVTCSILCYEKGVYNQSFEGSVFFDENNEYKLCSNTNYKIAFSEKCQLKCIEHLKYEINDFQNFFSIWGFILLMSLGNVCYNVANSISDAICFDVIGSKYDYGKQRVWGSIGFGLSALLGGYLVNLWAPGHIKTYVPVFFIMIIFTIIDLLACTKLKLPVIPPPKNIFKDLCKLLSDGTTVIFLCFAVFAGIIDSFIIYFLFWYLEDLALETGTGDIKLLEGLIVAAETLGGEIIFFSLSGKIISILGFANCFSICFINYAIRLFLISLAPSPWWILPVELVMQGPSFALTYTTIVAYANEIAPPGMTATTQGIAAGLDDGFGYAIGCISVGILYEMVGGRFAMQIFSGLALVCGLTHFLIHMVIGIKSKRTPFAAIYETPDAALKHVVSN